AAAVGISGPSRGRLGMLKPTKGDETREPNPSRRAEILRVWKQSPGSASSVLPNAPLRRRYSGSDNVGEGGFWNRCAGYTYVVAALRQRCSRVQSDAVQASRCKAQQKGPQVSTSQLIPLTSGRGHGSPLKGF